jgi:CheY-like chemotaxis protein
LPTRRTLLVADDSPTVRKVVALTFDDEGFRVAAAASGAEALEEIGRAVPDVILADVHMPAPGGYELCARVKGDRRTRDVPVLLLVGAFEPFDEAEARSCGADGVLTKPFQSIRDLVSKVGGLLGGQHEPSHASSRDEGAATHVPPPGDAHAPRGATESAAGARPAARQAASPYPDFDMDDADIESVPAAEFDARQHAQPAETFADEAGDSFAALGADAEDLPPAVGAEGGRGESRSEPARAFSAVEPASFVEAEPSVNASYEPSANTSAPAADPNSSANFSGETSAPASNEPPVSEPKESAVSASDEPFVSPPDESSAGSQQNPSAVAGARAQGFEERADAAAAADDTLLELGDIDSPPARRAAPDDFVLDFDDDAGDFAPHAAAAESSHGGPSFDSQSFDSPSHAARSAGGAAYQPPPYAGESYAEPSYAEPPFSEDAPSAVEMQSAGSVSMAEPSAAWDAAQEFTVSPDAVTEPVASPAWEEPEARETAPDGVDVQTAFDAEDPRRAQGRPAPDAARDADATSFARASDPRRGEHDTDAQSAPQAGAQLSPEAVDAIARRVVELLSDRAVREIAWEVVPDLAERLIRQRLEEERARAR